MADELKACPFCGGEAVVDGEDSTWAMLCRVRCGTCNANRMSYAKTRASAIKDWNRRDTPVVPPRADVERAIRNLRDHAYADGDDGLEDPSLLTMEAQTALLALVQPVPDSAGGTK